MVIDFIGTACAGLFAGAAIYVSFVEHPARLECGTEAAATEFGPSYRRGAPMQASLAALGFLAGVVAWFQERGPLPLLGGLALGAAIVFTLVVIFPTNKRLLDPALDRRSAESAALLRRWGRLHAVRTTLSVIAFGLFLYHSGRG